MNGQIYGSTYYISMYLFYLYIKQCQLYVYKKNMHAFLYISVLIYTIKYGIVSV